jgi:hypothetical protein
MATILNFLTAQSVFEPSDIEAMSAALDDVCRTLNLPGGRHAAREAVAERIIELARRGERDPARLRDRVLHEAGLSDGNGDSR